jgi:hypothetical protein
MLTKACASPSGNVPRSGFKPLPVYLEQVSTFQDSKYFGLEVPMEWWTESGRVGSFNNCQSFIRSLWRQPHRKLKTKRGDLHDGNAFGGGMEELKWHGLSS